MKIIVPGSAAPTFKDVDRTVPLCSQEILDLFVKTLYDEEVAFKKAMARLGATWVVGPYNVKARDVDMKRVNYELVGGQIIRAYLG